MNSSGTQARVLHVGSIMLPKMMHCKKKTMPMCLFTHAVINNKEQ